MRARQRVLESLDEFGEAVYLEEHLDEDLTSFCGFDDPPPRWGSADS